MKDLTISQLIEEYGDFVSEPTNQFWLDHGFVFKHSEIKNPWFCAATFPLGWSMNYEHSVDGRIVGLKWCYNGKVYVFTLVGTDKHSEAIKCTSTSYHKDGMLMENKKQENSVDMKHNCMKHGNVNNDMKDENNDLNIYPRNANLRETNLRQNNTRNLNNDLKENNLENPIFKSELATKLEKRRLQVEHDLEFMNKRYQEHKKQQDVENQTSLETKKQSYGCPLGPPSIPSPVGIFSTSGIPSSSGCSEQIRKCAETQIHVSVDTPTQLSAETHNEISQELEIEKQFLQQQKYQLQHEPMCVNLFGFLRCGVTEFLKKLFFDKPPN